MQNKKQIAKLFRSILSVHKGVFFNGTIEENYRLERILIKVADINIKFKNDLDRHLFIKDMIGIK